MIIIKCSSCGFILYEGRELKVPEDVLKMWDFRCPMCLSPLSTNVEEWGFEVRPRNVEDTLSFLKYTYKTYLYHATSEYMCDSCGKKIQINEVYVNKGVKLCLQCMIKELTSSELNALILAISEKFGIDPDKIINCLRNRKPLIVLK